MGGSLCSCDTLLQRLSQDLQDMRRARGPLVQQENAMVRQGPLPGRGRWPPPITPTSEIVCCGARNGHVVTKAVRPPVRPATR
jgi:hypothetical protein